ncbi:PIR Superfamily Protein [Plasmodium ovale wallikeri]|uniref:PIR Superfamily Protein n=2 Tax=Plasmodium ovale TaxID=36330 RepID=A0A1A9ANE6_PLAOA|nr:PIR Superfamily Protein [Plasmodium ovale wallikeri]SBT58194.1 PIR Superfamily Protein [Plasmodium ovale wallikeri]SBT72678.1 PIR protein [Plasmodium ovale]
MDDDSALEEEISKIPEHTFFHKLDDEENLQSSDIETYMNKCSDCSSNTSIKEYSRKVIRNYIRYKEYVSDKSPTKYCRYLKHWLFREKYKFQSHNTHHKDSWDKCIPFIWKELEKSHDDSGKKCNFDKENYPNAIVNMRRYLDDFCSIKEYLGEIEKIKLDRNKCLFYNKKMYSHIKIILRLIASISYNTNIKASYFTLDEKCSFSNFDKTFPEITCPSNCSPCNSEPPVAKGEALCSSTENEPDPRTDVPDKIVDEHGISNCSPTGIILSSTTTLLITVLVFFILYKFSPFGSWLFNRLSKQNKSLKNLEDEINGNISEFPLKVIERNHENMRNYIGYEAQ